MPIPSPNRFKDKDSFIQRCMEVEVGSGKDQDQAYAICNTTWENRNMTSEQRVLRKLNQIPLTNEEEMKAPCWDGYEMIGTKIVDGREVPNCVKID